MGCIDCVEIGPPPDNILFLPPPPVPNFVSNALPSDFFPVNTTSCTLAQLCESFLVTITAAPKLGHASGDYFELPGKGRLNIIYDNNSIINKLLNNIRHKI